MAVAAGKREVTVCSDAMALAAEAARRVIAAARNAIAARGRFTLVLSGGSTPERTYTLLAEPQRRSLIDWSRTWLFFGDERCVPHDDPRSNYAMAAKALLEPAAIDPSHVLAVATDVGSPAECAARYENSLSKFFAGGSPGQSMAALPQFDMILLGLGDDGHTASLFPGKESLIETQAWVTWSSPGVLPPPVDRVTFTFPLINAAREVMFFVSGAGKASIVREILEGAVDVQKHPSSGVNPDSGKLIWLLDEPAAKLLSTNSASVSCALNPEP